MTSTQNSTSQDWAARTDKALTAVAKIAELQVERAKLIAELAARVDDYDKAIAAYEHNLRNAVRAMPTTVAKPVARAFSEHKVNAGDLGGDTISTVERAAKASIYPEPYQPIRAAYALVENYDRR